MTAAKPECYRLLQQCYQLLYTLLGVVDIEVDSITRLTPENASTVAATLQGDFLFYFTRWSQSAFKCRYALLICHHHHHGKGLLGHVLQAMC